jgi:hypothetical protein
MDPRRNLLSLAFGAVAVYHALEALWRGSAIGKGSTAAHGLTAGLALLPGDQAAQFGAWLAAQVPLQVPLEQQHGEEGLAALAAYVLHTPLRLLLPHVCFACCSAAACLAAFAYAVDRMGSAQHTQHGHGSTKDIGGVAAGAAFLQRMLLVLVLQVGDGKTPLLMLAGAVEVGACIMLLRIKAQHAYQACSRQRGACMEGAAILALIQSHMFFATGHLCEFAGLHYTAGGFLSVCLSVHMGGNVILVSTNTPSFQEEIVRARDYSCTLILQASSAPMILTCTALASWLPLTLSEQWWSSFWHCRCFG